MPVIAAVNGPATGGGLALALAADIRIGSTGARFNAAFVRIGLSAGDLGTSWLLPRLIGPARAAEFAYTGRFIEAEEAERIGLLNRVVARRRRCSTRRSSWRAQIAANSPGGVQLSKRALQANMEAALVRRRARAREPRPGAADPRVGHARGARRLQGEARPALHGRMKEILEQPTIARAFLRSVELNGEREAVREFGTGRSMTYDEWLAALRRRRRRARRKLGVKRGDRVALMLTNRLEFHVVDMGAVLLGAAPFSLYNTAPVEQLLVNVDNAEPVVLIAEAQFADRARELVALRPQIKLLVLEEDLEALEAAARASTSSRAPRPSSPATCSRSSTPRARPARRRACSTCTRG